ncbi:MAG: AAA-like domain-containing protein [Woeseiaceae bacterium]|nr:AAA-like domain-containing protein [Woeseiaceae bacterium]
MTEDAENRSSTVLDKTAEFFNVGSPLHAVRPGYIRRGADDLLFDTLMMGHYAHVIAPDRTGKTSLIAATSARLQNNGFKVAVLDLNQISERDGGSDGGRWFYSIAYRLCRQLRLKTDLQSWWQDHSILSNRQRLVEFYAQIVLKNIQERIIVFIDEVQNVAELPFAEHLLASIRTAHNARPTEPEFNRLGFVLIGECDPLSLIDDPKMSPFAISTEVRPGDFTRDNLQVFAAELNLSVADAEAALDRVYFWTSGQPYLSQKLSRAIARETIKGDLLETIDRLASHQLGGRAATTSEPHMSYLHRVVINDRKNYESLLTTLGKIRKGIKISYDPDSARHRKLLAMGFVVVNEQGDFEIRNRLYESVFTAKWANDNLPLHWRGPAIAAAVVIALTAIPFLYTQVLPKPYLQVMTNHTYDLETVSDAYANLRSFPGHDQAADRMYRSVIENRARLATDRDDIRNISRFAAVLPGGLALADRMQAEYWDRTARMEMRNENRDAALLATLESLVLSTQVRRRRAASLIADDYTGLQATVPTQSADHLVFNAESAQLSYFKGPEVTQWSISESAIQSREPWKISALEVSPLVRRVIVDREGTASRIGLTINVSHPRLDDIRMRLSAPSGRTADIQFDQPSSAANEEIRIPRSQLDPLVGEMLTGTWSLSLRDEAMGVAGHLMNWDLSLNSQVAVETFDRGLDIPDPVERPSENLWQSTDGRYAVARALQSDSARVWDLNYAQAARTIAVPANEQVLGLSANATYLVTVIQNRVNLWRTADGSKSLSFELGESVTDTTLSEDGQYLLVTYQSDPDTLFEVWLLDSGDIVAEMSIAGVPAIRAIDASATYIAVADYDRALRIWNLREGAQIAQFDLEYQPTEIHLSANGDAMGALLGGQGVVMWKTSQPDEPLFKETGPGEWSFAFSRSGARFVAGNQNQGVRAYRTSDAVPTGPVIDPGLKAETEQLLAFSSDEQLLVTAGVGDVARFWSVPVIAANTAQDELAPEKVWRESAASISAVSEGGERMAFGDNSGHVHIEKVGTPSGENTAADEISFLGHQGGVLSMQFSGDGSVVASSGSDGTIRVWDAVTGLPRAFYGRSTTSIVDKLEFSPTAGQLAVLGGQRVWLMDAETGAELASVDLGEVHHDIAFATDQTIYLGAESGVLRNLYSDRNGNWHMRNVWQGSDSIHHVEIAAERQNIVLVNSRNEVMLLDSADGRVSSETLTLPSQVEEVAFSPNESRVLFRSGRWIHRALVTPTGLIWTDTARAPKAMNGSGMAFEIGDGSELGQGTNPSGDRVLILARDTGVTELSEVRFNYTDGPSLFGSRNELLHEWKERLEGLELDPFLRQGL